MQHARSPHSSTTPELDFQIVAAAARPYAASPSLQFTLQIESRGGTPIRSVMLHVQIQIASAQRHYNTAEQVNLVELFGPPRQWANSLKTLPWLQAVVLVPQFVGSTTVEVVVPCTYDFEVLTAKYFHALEEGEIPLDFLFSGTLFYAGTMGLQVVQISWEKEASYRLPVRVWQAMMEHYFPHSAWLRLERATFDRLYRFKARAGLPTWEAALEALLDQAEEE